jgi:hypothetical protein
MHQKLKGVCVCAAADSHAWCCHSCKCPLTFWLETQRVPLLCISLVWGCFQTQPNDDVQASVCCIVGVDQGPQAGAMQRHMWKLPRAS